MCNFYCPFRWTFCCTVCCTKCLYILLEILLYFAMTFCLQVYYHMLRIKMSQFYVKKELLSLLRVYRKSLTSKQTDSDEWTAIHWSFSIALSILQNTVLFVINFIKVFTRNFSFQIIYIMKGNYMEKIFFW